MVGQCWWISTGSGSIKQEVVTSSVPRPSRRLLLLHHFLRIPLTLRPSWMCLLAPCGNESSKDPAMEPGLTSNAYSGNATFADGHKAEDVLVADRSCRNTDQQRSQMEGTGSCSWQGRCAIGYSSCWIVVFFLQLIGHHCNAASDHDQDSNMITYFVSVNDHILILFH